MWVWKSGKKHAKHILNRRLPLFSLFQAVPTAHNFGCTQVHYYLMTKSQNRPDDCSDTSSFTKRLKPSKKIIHLFILYTWILLTLLFNAGTYSFILLTLLLKKLFIFRNFMDSEHIVERLRINPVSNFEKPKVNSNPKIKKPKFNPASKILKPKM